MPSGNFSHRERGRLARARSADDDGPAAAILRWFDANRRDLPWRVNRTPYRILVSEIMLQQTGVSTVIPYYGRFLDAFPTAESLAAAPLERVHKVWEGLGYYARARNLQAAARAVVERHAGVFPETLGDLRALPGLGPYTAAAVGSIAFGLPEPAIDGNAFRVYARLSLEFGKRGDRASDARVDAFARSLLPAERAGDWNEAIMELGAVVCRPRNPRCDECPVASACRAHREKATDAIPAARPRAVRPVERRVLLVARDRQGAVLLAKRPPRGLWAGLYEPPARFVEDGEQPEDAARALVDEHFARPRHFVIEKPIRHVFTHKEWLLIPARIDVSDLTREVNADSRRLVLDRKSVAEVPLPAPIARLIGAG